MWIDIAWAIVFDPPKSESVDSSLRAFKRVVQIASQSDAGRVVTEQVNPLSGEITYGTLTSKTAKKLNVVEKINVQGLPSGFSLKIFDEGKF